MANSWGTSWGSAWGSSWGTVPAPPPVDQPDLFWSASYREMTYVASVIPPLAWLGGTLVIASQISAQSWRLDYAQEGGDLYWSVGSTAMFWSTDSAQYWSNLPLVYAPWPGELKGYTRQAYYFKLTTAGGRTQGVVAQLQAIFDMPDIEEILLNVSIDPVGTRLPVTKPFRVIAVVAPTVIEDNGDAARIRVLDKEAVGPLVVAVDALGVSVPGHGDFILRGY